MTAAVYESDIDKFIKDQKSKLAHERRVLDDDGRSGPLPDNKRRQWDRSGLERQKLAEQTQRRPPSSEGRTGLRIGTDAEDVKKRQLQAERKREYNELLQKKPPRRNQPPPEPDDNPPMTRQPAHVTRPDPPRNTRQDNYATPRQNIIPTGENEELRRNRLRSELQMDYKEFMAKKNMLLKKKHSTPTKSQGLPIGDYDEAKRTLKLELEKEYKAKLDKQQEEHENYVVHQLELSGEIDPPSDVDDEYQMEKFQPNLDKHYHHFEKKHSPFGSEIDLPYTRIAHFLEEEKQLSNKEYSTGLNLDDLQNEHIDRYSKSFRPSQRIEDRERTKDHMINGGHQFTERYLESQREKQLSELEEIHYREEKLRRRLDEDKIRESDQEHMLKEEMWRRHHGNPKLQETKWAVHPAHFRQGDYEQYRERLNEERKHEYNNMMMKKQGTERPRYYKSSAIENPTISDQHKGHYYKDTVDSYPVRASHRNQYDRKPAQKSDRRYWREPSGDEIGLAIGQDDRKKEALAAERRKEMQEAMNKKQASTRREWRDSTEHTGLKLATSEQPRNFGEEKRREYNEHLRNKKSKNLIWREPSTDGAVLFVPEREKALEYARIEAAKSRAKTNDMPQRIYREISNETGLNIGQYEEQKRKLAEERRKDLEREKILKSNNTPRRQYQDNSEETGLNIGQYEEQKRKLAEERRKDMEREKILKSNNTPRRPYQDISEETGLNIGQYEELKRKLAEERRKDYERDKIQKESYWTRSVDPWPVAMETGFHLGEYEPVREKYQLERNRDYNRYLAQQPPLSDRRYWREPSDSSIGIDFHKYDWRDKYRKKNIEPQHFPEVLDYKGPSHGRMSVPPLYFGSRSEEIERLAQTEREYYDLLSKLTGGDSRSNLPPKPGTPGGFLNKLGKDHERKRVQLNEERNREYNEQRIDRRGRGSYRDDPGSFGSTIPGLRGADSAKLEKMKKRNEEYNEFLREKENHKIPNGGEKHGYQHRPPNTYEPESAIINTLAKNYRYKGTYATLPGLNYENKRSHQNEIERNREYNEFLRQKTFKENEDHFRSRSQGQEVPPDAPRRGWATPTYEEMLQKKRQEESKYRRFDDPEYRRPGGMKSYGSEGALNDGLKRGGDLDTELEKRLRFDDRHRSILDDPLWLSPRRGDNYDRAYAAAPEAELSTPVEIALPTDDIKVLKGGAKQYQDIPQRKAEPPPPPQARTRPRDADYYATLPVGSEERVSAQQRKKEQYRRELQQQMQEAYEAKQRERIQEMKVSATGAKNPEQRDDRLRGLGASSAPPPPVQVIQAPAPVYQVADPAPVYTTRVNNYDKLSPRSELVLGRKSLYAGDDQWSQIQQLDRINFDLDRQRYTAPSGSTGGILERGFDSLLDPPRVSSVQVPPGLEYTPSSFITGGGGGITPMDDAYNYLATRNPLTLDLGGGAAQPQVSTSAVAAAAGPSSIPQPARVRFDEDKRRQPPGGGATFAADAGDDKAANRARAQSYQAELARQMEENKAKKAKAKAEQEWYEMKLEREAQDYHPYGKGGGGAPLKDDRGNTLADLRAMKKGYTPRGGVPPTTFSTSPRPPTPRDDKIKTPPNQTTAFGDATHARGGHGIFGMPKTEAEKHQSDVYKDDLRRQIEAKKAIAAAEREKERYEEEREARRIEAERKKMQDEYEEERKKLKAKEDEARRKNEELMRQAEERKREAEQQRQHAEDERRRQQEEEDRIRLERELQQSKADRARSPPVPAVSRKQATQPENGDAARKTPAPNSRPQSGVKPATDEPDDPFKPSALTHRVDLHSRSHTPVDPSPSQRAPSADVLNALARMKRELASERDRVENMLDKNENEPEVFDPRLAQRPPPVPRTTHDIDVFERARNRNTVPVRRAPTVQEHPPNPSLLNEFNELKQADTDSRNEFKRQYPYDPMSNDHLEQQQAALLRQQEENLRQMRDKSKFERALPNMEPKDLGLARHHTLSPQPMLQSNSAFIDMNGVGPVFPDDLDDLPRRNDSARQRRRDRLFSSPRPGSVTSLDVDQIARKNEQRLKRLRDMQGDDVSMNDPDDVLDRFVSKQSHNRPPTSQTMQDDSWLLAGSKNSRY